MMKTKDCAVATALIIQGYMRTNVLETNDENEALAEAIAAIRQECDDWAENLESGDPALEATALQVVLLEAKGGDASRSPYNLGSAAVALAQEVIDLGGPEELERMIARLQALRSEPERFVKLTDRESWDQKTQRRVRTPQPVIGPAD